MIHTLLRILIVPFDEKSCTAYCIHGDLVCLGNIGKQGCFDDPYYFKCTTAKAFIDSISKYFNNKYPPVEPKVGDMVEYRESMISISKTGELLYTIPDKYSGSNKHLLGVTRGSLSYATFQHIEPKSSTVTHTVEGNVHTWSIEEEDIRCETCHNCSRNPDNIICRVPCTNYDRWTPIKVKEDLNRLDKRVISNEKVEITMWPVGQIKVEEDEREYERSFDIDGITYYKII